MTDSVWMRQAVPWLGRGFIHCVHEEATAALREDLDRLGFTEVTLDGARMTDAESFHAEAMRAFRFPDYYGRNWDAFDECFGEIEFTHPTALTWTSADRLAAADLKTFAEAIAVFRSFRDKFAKRDADSVEVAQPVQIELFLTGHGAAFRRPDDPLAPGWSL